MSNKMRKFKSSEDNSRYWSGSTNKSVSTMKNYDISYAEKTGDWSYLMDIANKSSARAKFNRENNLTEPVSYDKYSNKVGYVNFKKLYTNATG